MNAIVEPDKPLIRPMTRGDVPRIDAIEQRSYPFPWSSGIFHDCLQAGYECLVMADSQGILAYAVVSIAAREAHILNLCVAPERRGCGAGRTLLDHVDRLARAQRAEHLFLEVRPSNHAARRLYDSAGFNQVGTRPDYYPAPDGREDALILALDLTVPRAR